MHDDQDLDWDRRFCAACLSELAPLDRFPEATGLDLPTLVFRPCLCNGLTRHEQPLTIYELALLAPILKRAAQMAVEGMRGALEGREDAVWAGEVHAKPRTLLALAARELVDAEGLSLSWSARERLAARTAGRHAEREAGARHVLAVIDTAACPESTYPGRRAAADPQPLLGVQP